MYALRTRCELVHTVAVTTPCMPPHGLVYIVYIMYIVHIVYIVYVVYMVYILYILY